jgi:hypothetical protein
VALQEIDLDIKSVKELTAKRLTHLLPSFHCYCSKISNSSRSLQIENTLKLRNVEAYISQNGLTQCYIQLSAFWPHLGALQATSSLPVVWVVTAILSDQRNRAQAVSTPSKLQRLQSCKTEMTAQKEPESDNTGVSRENIPLEIRVHSIRSIIRCCIPQFRSAASAATITTNAETDFRKNVHQCSQCRLQV